MIGDWIGRHRRSLLMLFALLTIVGALSMSLLPVGLFPQINFPRIVVSIDAGDRPVERMAAEVTRPLEEALRGVPDVKTIRSTSSRGSAEISLSFAWGTDMTAALLQTQGAVNAALSGLPAGTSYSVRRMDPTVFPMMGVSVTSPSRTQTSLHDLAQYQIAPALSSIDGVAKVDVLGGRLAEYQVVVDPMRLQALGLGTDDVAKSLGTGNVVAAVGRVEDRYRLYLTLVDSRLVDVAALRRIVLRADANGVVTLGDVASVQVGEAPAWTRVNAAGRDAVLVNVMQQPGGNTVAIAANVRAAIASMRASLPSDVALAPYYDQSELVSAAAGSVRDAIVIGAILAGLILLLFLRNRRITLIVSLILPVVLLGSATILHLLGQSLNIMTLGGMAAAVGLVVDDAVVMVEHICRRLAEHQRDGSGAPPQPLAFAMEMLRPLAGSSAATVGVFLPLAFLGGVAGGFFRPLALTMATTLVVSFFVALVLVPLLAGRLLRPQDAQSLTRVSPWQVRLSALTHGLLGTTLRRPTLLVGALILLTAAGGLAYRQLGSGFMPRMDEGGFIFDYRAAPGTSLEETNRLMTQVEAIIQAQPEVDTYSRRTGLQLGGGLTESNEGDMFIKLKPPPRKRIDDVMSTVRAEVEARVPGLTVETAQLMEDLIGDLTSTPQPIEVKLFGTDIAQLRTQAQRVADAIGRIPGVVEVMNGITIAGDALEVQVDPAAAALEGMNADDVARQATALLNGTPVGAIQSGEKMQAIRIWSPPDLRRRIEQVGQLPLRSPSGQSIPLSRLATIRVVPGQAQQDREDLRPMVAVTARLEGIDLGTAMRRVRSSVDQLQLGQGVSVEYGGLYPQQQQSFKELTLVFCGALLLVATLLMFLYERLAVVLAILASVLLTLPGVFVGLWVTGTELNLSSMIGLTMIVGIVTEIAIFYFAEIDTAGAIDIEALQHAAAMRLRPILMTALIAILALLPLALGIGTGSQMQRPLAITIISGLIVAVPIVLLAMPALFLLFDRRRHRLPPHAPSAAPP